MTISSTVRKAGPFDGTGSQTEFPFEFKVFSAGDLYVVQYNEATGVETVLELDSDYTVTLNADQDNDPGGTVELNSALAVNYTLTITSNLANLQPTDLTNRGGFYPSVINDALDRACIQIQQLQDDTDRTLKTAVSVPDGVDNTLPMPAANMVIGWDNTGVALKNWSVNDLVTSVAYGSAKADIFTGDGETVDFYLELDPASINNLDVSVGGVCQVPVDDYTWTSGTKVTFTTAPPDGETILIRYMQALPTGTVTWANVYDAPFIDKYVYINQDTTITTEVNVIEGGMFIISSGKTLTINGPFSCGLFQCFSGAGSVVFGNGSVAEVYPEWWGAKGDDSTDCISALNRASSCASASNCKVTLSQGVYRVSAVWKAAHPISGACPNTSIIKNTGTGDALYLGGAGYYVLFENFQVQGNASSRDGISLWTAEDGGELAYSQFRSVYSYSNGRHGLYHRRAWGTKYDACKFGKEAHGNGGLGVFLDTEVLDEGTHNGVLFTGCDSRWNGGTSTSTTYNDDKGGVKIKGGAGVLWLGGVIESNNAWGVMVIGVPGISAVRDIHFEGVYSEHNPLYATVGGNFYAEGPWSNFSVTKCWLSYGGTGIGKTGYCFYITGGEDGNGNTPFKDSDNTTAALGVSGATDVLYSSGSRSALPATVRVSPVFGDSAALGSIVNTTIVTITADGSWLLTGTIHFRRNSDNTGATLPFVVAYDPSVSGRQISVGSTVAGTSTASPTLSFSGDNLTIQTPAYCYAFVEVNECVIVPPTTLSYNSTLFGIFMRRK